jgi:hypothetical protein
MAEATTSAAAGAAQRKAALLDTASGAGTGA